MRVVGGSDVGVGGFFLANGGWIAVAGEDDGVRWKGHQLRPYAFDEQAVIAGHEVGASDASLKQYVAGYGPARFREVEYKATRRMARYGDYFHFLAAYVDGVSVGKGTIDCHRLRIKGQAEHAGLCRSMFP